MQEKNVIEYYIMCNKLKNLVRSGWQDLGVSAERVESVAEHIFGVQMLAIAMYSEFGYKINLEKVLFMLAVHELEEILIGDLTPFESAYKDKEKLGHEAIRNVLKNLKYGKNIEKIILEFDAKQTQEALFANQCDKLEADIQCKLYDENNCMDIALQQKNPAVCDEEVKTLLKENKSLSKAWIEYWQAHQKFDDNFMKVINYIKTNKISKNDEKL